MYELQVERGEDMLKDPLAGSYYQVTVTGESEHLKHVSALLLPRDPLTAPTTPTAPT